MRISDWSSAVCSADLPAGTAQAIIDARPDVVMLQEVNGGFRPMLAALEQHFAHATNCPSGCDLAIFSRWPIIGSDYFLKDAAGRKFGHALLWSRIAPPAGEAFLVATLHLPRPTSRHPAVVRHSVLLGQSAPVRLCPDGRR